MKTINKDGSFQLRWDKATGNYTAQGDLIYGVHINKAGYAFRTVKEGGPTWQYLVDQGKQEMRIMERLKLAQQVQP